MFLGQQLVQSSSVSEETSKKIEEEVRRLVQQGMDDARRIMTDHRAQWEAVAEGLLEYETLTGEEIDGLLQGNKPDRPDASDEDDGPASAVPVIGKKRAKPEGEGEGFEGDPKPA